MQIWKSTAMQINNQLIAGEITIMILCKSSAVQILLCTSITEQITTIQINCIAAIAGQINYPQSAWQITTMQIICPNQLL